MQPITYLTEHGNATEIIIEVTHNGKKFGEKVCMDERYFTSTWDDMFNAAKEHLRHAIESEENK